jgi:hypothetical protein
MNSDLRDEIIYKIDNGKYRDAIKMLESLISDRETRIGTTTSNLQKLLKEGKYDDAYDMLENMDSDAIKRVFLQISSPINWALLWCESHKPFKFLIRNIQQYFISKNLERGNIWSTLLTIYELDSSYDKSPKQIKYHTDLKESFWKKLDLIMANDIWKNTFSVYINNEKNKQIVQTSNKLIQEIKSRYNIQDLYD